MGWNSERVKSGKMEIKNRDKIFVDEESGRRKGWKTVEKAREESKTECLNFLSDEMVRLVDR